MYYLICTPREGDAGRPGAPGSHSGRRRLVWRGHYRTRRTALEHVDRLPGAVRTHYRVFCAYRKGRTPVFKGWPSRHETKDAGAWTLVANMLATGGSILVHDPDGMSEDEGRRVKEWIAEEDERIEAERKAREGDPGAKAEDDEERDDDAIPDPGGKAEAKDGEPPERPRIPSTLAGLGDLGRSITSYVDESAAIINRRIENVAASGGVQREIVVRIGDEPERKIEGHAHESFEDVLRLVRLGLPALLVGPAGCGKTHMCGQIASALDLPFRVVSMSAGVTEGQLLGRLLPTGEGGRFEYARSILVETYEEGGVVLLDEIDGADENALMCLHAAMENGTMTVPNRLGQPEAKRHDDFRLVAAANTFGHGADRMYVGRNQLDAATLNRFALSEVAMGYDTDLERALCPDAALRTAIEEVRMKAHKAKLRRVVSTRTMDRAYRLMQAYDLPVDDLLRRMTVGWTDDERETVGIKA